MKKLLVVLMLVMLSVNVFAATWAAKIRPGENQGPFEDSSVWTWGDNAYVKFGDSGDVTLQWDATNFELFAIAADTPFAIGGTTYGFDMTYYFETAGTVDFDYDGDNVTFSDAIDLILGTDGDFVIDSDTAKTLDFTPAVTTDDAVINMGANTTGCDLKLFGATTGEYWLWDASADSILPNCGNALFTMTDAEANQFKVDATGTVAGYAVVVETTDGGVQINADGASNGDISIDAADDLTLTAAGDLVLAVTGSVTGNTTWTGNITRASQQYVQTIGYCKVGTTAGWVVPAAADAAHLATLPQSQTASTLVIPITMPLKVGDTITAWTINGQIDSGGNTATLDAKLYKHTEATAGFANAAVGSGMAQLSKTADYKVVEGESGLSEVVAADESFYLLVTGTTAATTDIEIASITVTLTEI